MEKAKAAKKALCLLLFAAMIVSTMVGLIVGGLQFGLKAHAAEAVVEPLALYEFKDESSVTKDSMGNYDLEFKNLWKQDGTGPLLDKFELVDGGVSFNGEFCIGMPSSNNLFEKVTAFTLAFEVKTASFEEWQHYIGIGNDENYFAFVGRGDASNPSAVEKTFALNAHGVAGEYWEAAFINDASNWGDSVNTFQKVVVTVQPGGEMNVYVNGVLFIKESKLPGTLPEDWKAGGAAGLFSIGARCNGPADRASKGSMRNVAIYDFAMDAAAVSAYNTTGALTKEDVAGLTTIQSAHTVFEGEATRVKLNKAMTTEQMFSNLNPAKAEVTLSDESTREVNLTWIRVYEEGEKFYAEGKLESSSLGVANVYGNVIYELEVANIKSVGKPQFTGEALKGELLDTMSEEEMLALINKANVTVVLGDDAERTVEVVFDRIVASMGVYTALADVVVDGATVATVEYVLTVTETGEGDAKELLPIAKWEFEDAENTGKDSMGNYNLQAAAKEGGNTSDPRGMGEVQNGVLYVDGDDCLTLPSFNDIGDKLDNGFTLNFQYKQDGDQKQALVPGDWASPISFGFNDWAPTTYCRFLISTDGAGDMLRFVAHDATFIDGKPEAYWGPSMIEHAGDTWHNVTLTVRPGEKISVYADGKSVFSEDCPSGWTLTHSNMSFAIGGECVWGNGYNFFKGWLDNVTVYNFAMTLDQSNAYWQKGKIVVGDMNGEIITSIDQTPVFEGEITNNKLTDKLTDTQFIRRMNPATVNAVFANEKTVALPVTWVRSEKVDGKYYAVGVVDASNLGYATLLTGQTEVRQEVTVEEVPRKIVIGEGIVNGTVSADKTEAKLGETVTFTVSPAKGYELQELSVNGTVVSADENGKYTITVSGINDLEVFATFRATAKKGGGCSGSITAQSLIVVLPVLLCAAFLVVKKTSKKVK